MINLLTTVSFVIETEEELKDADQWNDETKKTMNWLIALEGFSILSWVFQMVILFCGKTQLSDATKVAGTTWAK